MTRELATDVIVVGAGPVGLVAALTLAKAGIRVLVLEKRDSLTAASRASTFHPATLEILDALGVLQEVRSQGVKVERIQYRTPAGPFAEFAMTDLAERTTHPYRLHLEQARVTPVIMARLQALANVTIAFGADVTAIAQTEHDVLVTAGSGARSITARATFLIGADGARSTVRDALGISFDGIAYADKILRVMTTDDLNVILSGIAAITYLFNGPKSVSFLQMPDCWRIILRVPEATDNAIAMRDDWLAARLAEVLPTWTTPPHVADKDVYSVSRRVASRFSSGRAFLAGDSAHVTNTRGGMNMNCGIHDAFALANAMIKSIRTGRSQIVDGVAIERKRVADEMLIPRTDRNVSGGQEWLDNIRDIAASHDKASDYLATAAMLDMLERPVQTSR